MDELWLAYLGVRVWVRSPGGCEDWWKNAGLPHTRIQHPHTLVYSNRNNIHSKIYLYNEYGYWRQKDIALIPLVEFSWLTVTVTSRSWPLRDRNQKVLVTPMSNILTSIQYNLTLLRIAHQMRDDHDFYNAKGWGLTNKLSIHSERHNIDWFRSILE
jgi:hypothetical protein